MSKGSVSKKEIPTPEKGIRKKRERIKLTCRYVTLFGVTGVLKSTKYPAG
jgi:hypothetical protein